jgi:hypothetical protein
MLSKGVFKNQIELIEPMRLKELTALIIGAGSVGSNLVHTMNKFGFSSFVIYDYDIWEVHNSASSIYPFKETEELAPMCKRSYDQWTYTPAMPLERDGWSYPPYSIFKVDILKKEISRNDPNIYYEEYRLPFGESMVNAFTKFNQSISKMGARTMFTNDGQPRRSSMGTMEFNWIPQVKPDFMVLTTDTLQSRARCVWALRTMFKNEVFKHEGVFPIIDTRSLNTTQGEILVFDLLDDQDVHDWFNYSLPKKARTTFEELEEILNQDIDNVDELGFIDTEPNLCGDKMSILISNTISVYATNLIVNIFNEKVEWEKIPRSYLINTSPLMPYVTKNEKLLNE